MGTTTTTGTTNQYNAGAMNSYNAFQPQLMSNLMGMVNNPLGNSNFQNQLAQQQNSAHQINQRSQSNMLQNMRAGGGILSNSGAFMNASLNRNMLAGSNMQSNAFNSSVNSALQNRGIAMASMQAYQPLQTGQTTNQSTGGLGTWLPQLVGAGLGAAMPGLNSMMGGGSFSSGYGGGGGGGAAPTSGNMTPQMAPPSNYGPNPYMYGNPSNPTQYS